MLRKYIKTLCLFFLILISSTTLASQNYSNNFHAKILTHHQNKIEYYEIGKGSPIVLIAGYATDISSWDQRFILTLAKYHRVIIFNNRNVGRSFHVSKTYTAKDLAEDTHQLIEGLHLSNTTLVGVSMGGMIAQKYATLYPTSLKYLILINTAPPGNLSIPPTINIQNEMFAFPENKFKQFIFAKKLFFPTNDSLFSSYNLLVYRFIPDDFVAINIPNVISSQQAVLLNWQKDNRAARQLKSLSTPVFILNGDADIVIPPVNSLILKKMLKNSVLVRWSNGGHGMIFQYPVEIAEVIHSYIL